MTSEKHLPTRRQSTKLCDIVPCLNHSANLQRHCLTTFKFFSCCRAVFSGAVDSDSIDWKWSFFCQFVHLAHGCPGYPRVNVLNLTLCDLYLIHIGDVGVGRFSSWSSCIAVLQYVVHRKKSLSAKLRGRVASYDDEYRDQGLLWHMGGLGAKYVEDGNHPSPASQSMRYVRAIIYLLLAWEWFQRISASLNSLGAFHVTILIQSIIYSCSKRPIRRNIHKRNHIDHVWPCGILLKNKKVAGLCWPKGDTMGVAEDVAQALQSLFALVAGEWKTLEDTGSRFCTLCALFVHSLLLWLILSCLSVSFRLSYCLFLCRGRLSLICTGSCSCELSSCETGRSIVSGCSSLWLSYTNTLLQAIALDHVLISSCSALFKDCTMDMWPDNWLSMPLQGCAMMLRDFLSLLIRGRLASVSAINKRCQFTLQMLQMFSNSCKMCCQHVSNLVNIVRHALYMSFTLSITIQTIHHPCFESDKIDLVRPRVNRTVVLCILQLFYIFLHFYIWIIWLFDFRTLEWFLVQSRTLQLCLPEIPATPQGHQSVHVVLYGHCSCAWYFCSRRGRFECLGLFGYSGPEFTDTCQKRLSAFLITLVVRVDEHPDFMHACVLASKPMCNALPSDMKEQLGVFSWRDPAL